MGRIARKALSFLTWGQGRRAEGRRFRAARDPGTGGQGTGQTAARVPCKGCNGHHPQEKACPNEAAKAEGMDPTSLQNSGLKCSYQAAEGEPVCDRVGHLRRHHGKQG